MDKNLIYLAQTDTTVGFLSHCSSKLNSIKQREPSKKILQEIYSFKELQNKVRVPQRFKKQVRNSTKTTFIYTNNLAFRVVDNSHNHSKFIKKFKYLYSTSANLTNKSFDIDFAQNSADIIVYSCDEFSNKNSSKIYKLYKTKIKKVR